MSASRDLAAAEYLDGFFAAPATAVHASLTRFQRILVATDGTVTRLLEAYAGEPMEAVKLEQRFDTADGRDREVAGTGERVLRRRVLLRGRLTGQAFLYAEAVARVDHLDPGLVDQLLRSDTPIGVVLAQRRTETFREVLKVDRQQAGAAAGHFGIEPSAEVVARTYRIVAGGRPVVLIDEKFPASAFPDPVR